MRPLEWLCRFGALVTAACLLVCAAPARAGCLGDVEPSHLVGAGRLCLFGFCLYDAQLWGDGAPDSFTLPFALRLTYRVHVKRARLVSTGLDEMRRLAVSPISDSVLSVWRKDMEQGLRDVAPGDTLCAVFLPRQGVRFYANGEPTAEIADPAFARAFFGIWLDTDSRAPALRKQLLHASQ